MRHGDLSSIKLCRISHNCALWLANDANRNQKNSQQNDKPHLIDHVYD